MKKADSPVGPVIDEESGKDATLPSHPPL